MKVTIFTSNQARHISLVESVAAVADECHVIVENSTVFPGKSEGLFKRSDVMESYFSNVLAAQEKIFGQVRALSGVNVTNLKLGDLSLLPKQALEDALNSDYFIVFGSSYIKGWLIDALIERRAINIHMGISPYYRGSSCNFWALYDDRPEVVGATIHLLSKGLDSGEMLRHVQARTEGVDNAFEYTMNAVRLTHEQLIEDMRSGALDAYEPVAQDKSQQLRYSRNKEFTDEIAQDFLNNPPTIEQIEARLDTARLSGRFLKLTDVAP